MSKREKQIDWSIKYNNSNKYYVYVYLDPRKKGEFKYGEYEFNYEPFYIGKGTGYRDRFHLNNIYNNNNNNFKDNRIKKILLLGETPIIIRIKNKLTENEALDLEIYLIKLIGRFDLSLGPLTNLTNGGDGISGYKFDDEYLSKIRIKIKQFDLDGTFIKEWDSIKEIKDKFGMISISDVCNLKRFSLHGYIWRYSDDLVNINNICNYINTYKSEQFNIRRINGKKNVKKIIEYDIKNNTIKEWDSLSNAADFYGITIQNISQTIKNNWVSLDKFWFKYEDYNEETLQKLLSKYINKLENKLNKIDTNYKSYKGKKVIQITDGKELKIWDSMSEVNKHLGIPISNINKVCNGERKKAGGYNWIWG